MAKLRPSPYQPEDRFTRALENLKASLNPDVGHVLMPATVRAIEDALIMASAGLSAVDVELKNDPQLADFIAAQENFKQAMEGEDGLTGETIARIYEALDFIIDVLPTGAAFKSAVRPLPPQE